MKLTEAGAALRAPAERMREHAQQFAMVAAGRSQTVAGTVRVTASEVFSAYVLPDLLLGLRRTHPEIQIELVASNAIENLLEREADIALRMLRPKDRRWWRGAWPTSRWRCTRAPRLHRPARPAHAGQHAAARVGRL